MNPKPKYINNKACSTLIALEIYISYLKKKEKRMKFSIKPLTDHDQEDHDDDDDPPANKTQIKKNL